MILRTTMHSAKPNCLIFLPIIVPRNRHTQAHGPPILTQILMPRRLELSIRRIARTHLRNTNLSNTLPEHREHNIPVSNLKDHTLRLATASTLRSNINIQLPPRHSTRLMPPQTSPPQMTRLCKARTSSTWNLKSVSRPSEQSCTAIQTHSHNHNHKCDYQCVPLRQRLYGLLLALSR